MLEYFSNQAKAVTPSFHLPPMEPPPGLTNSQQIVEIHVVEILYNIVLSIHLHEGIFLAAYSL